MYKVYIHCMTVFFVLHVQEVERGWEKGSSCLWSYGLVHEASAHNCESLLITLIHYKTLHSTTIHPHHYTPRSVLGL